MSEQPIEETMGKELSPVKIGLAVMAIALVLGIPLAYFFGHSVGYDFGHLLGHGSGYSAGYDSGCTSGFSEGYSEGREEWRFDFYYVKPEQKYGVDNLKEELKYKEWIRT